MTDHTIICERENGRVRVFSMAETDGADGPMFTFQRAIGATQLSVENVQRVDLADLGDMKLSDFLIAGYDPDRATFDGLKDTLDALSGVVFIVRSSAFIDRPATLITTGDVTLVATFYEQKTPVSFETLPSGGTKGPVEDVAQKKTPSDAAMGGRVATIALLVMAALVWVMIKIAG
ncbi:hypothetical protein N9741_02910 [Octadecabacter sp.]|nr:hypothetical protein [Octadecabacter sp.]